MSEHLPTGAEAHRKFDQARRQGTVERLVALLRGKPDDLLSFDDVQRKLGLHITRERGTQQTPLDQIVGSVGKYRDFTRAFWPKSEKLRERWKWLYVAAHDFRGLPPVDLYQVGEVYFVKDGNHRISVARALGSKTVEATVVEYISPARLTVETVDADLDALALQIERERFLGRTRLLELRPDAQIDLSQPGGYDALQEHMAVPAYVLGQQTGEPVAWDESVALWYDDVYTPVVRVIHEHGLLRRYPGRSDADLYLWLMEQRDALMLEPALEQALAAAARQFVATIGSPHLRWLAETRGEPGAWRTQRVLPRGDGPLFADILLPLDETDAAWQTVEDLLPLAARAGSRLHGLFAGQSLDDYGRAGAAMQRFAAACQARGVGWRVRAEIGPSGDDLHAVSGGYDLVVLRQGEAETRRQDELLGTQIQGVIRRVACPVLVLSQAKPRLGRVLLAYDGSPYAEEALYVAAHLATAWDASLAVVTVEEHARTSAATLDAAVSYLRQQGIDARGFFKGAQSGPAGVAGTILHVAAEQGSDLLLLGDSGYSPFVELFVRSTVDHVLREAGCSVMVCG
jgi:nucleotide-binding universal stress UspA family protein